MLAVDCEVANTWNFPDLSLQGWIDYEAIDAFVLDSVLARVVKQQLDISSAGHSSHGGKRVQNLVSWEVSLK